MKKILIITSIIVLCIFFGSTVLAVKMEASEVLAHEDGGFVIEHAKLNTADASPVDPGNFELEFGYSWGQAKHLWDNESNSRRRGLTREQATGLALTAGVTQNVDFSISLDYLWLRDDDNDSPTTGDNIGDLGFAGRYRYFVNEKCGIEAAWISGLTAPTGNLSDADELGTSQEFWSWDNALIFTKDWKQWTMNTELGWSLPFGEKRGDASGTLIANLAAGYQLKSWLQPELELNYTQDFEKNADDSKCLAFTAGLVMPVNEKLRINMGLQQAIWGKMADKSTNAMVSFKINL